MRSLVDEHNDDPVKSNHRFLPAFWSKGDFSCAYKIEEAHPECFNLNAQINFNLLVSRPLVSGMESPFTSFCGECSCFQFFFGAQQDKPALQSRTSADHLAWLHQHPTNVLKFEIPGSSESPIPTRL
jgi:hypothetical protein